MDSGFHAVESRFQVLNSSLCQWNLGRFPFVRTDRPDRFPRNEKFHLWSKLSSEVSQILNSMHEGDGFQQKPFWKSRFHMLSYWSSSGPAGQSWQMESALRFWIPIVSGILDSLSYIPNSKVQNCGFHKQKIPGLRNLDSLKRGDRRPYWLPPISLGF